MNTLKNCSHCGAPISIQKIHSRFFICEYCKSELFLEEELFNQAIAYQTYKQKEQEEKIKNELEIEKIRLRQAHDIEIIKQTQNAELQAIRNKQKAKQSLGLWLRRIIAFITVFSGAGCFGVPSFICGQPKIGISCIILTIIFLCMNAEFGFGVAIPMIILPIISILTIKSKKEND